jgi:hypothetical protein
LILSYIELGRDQDARAEAAEVMRISPHFAVASVCIPTAGAANNKRWLSAFRKAGLQ